MRFIHIADVHLGMRPDKESPWSEARAVELWDTFGKVIDICGQNRIDLLMIAGDLFHRRPTAGELKEISYLFSKIPRTKVVLMAGNHDYLPGIQENGNRGLRELAGCPNVYLFEKDTLDAIELQELGTTVYGLSYCKRSVDEQEYLQAVPDRKRHSTSFHILMVHGAFAGLQGAAFDYVALGHIHKPELFGGHMAYPGSLEPLDKTETGEHGYILGELSDGGRRLRFIPLAGREYRDLECTVVPEDTERSVYDKIQAGIAAQGNHNFYRIRLVGYREEAVKFRESVLKGAGYITEVEDRTVPDYDFDSICRQNQGNILGMFIERVKHLDGDDEWKDKVLYCGVEALLTKGGNELVHSGSGTEGLWKIS